MKLREAVLGDFDRLNELYEILDKEHREIHKERFQAPKEIGRSSVYKEELINSPDKQLIVAIIKKEIVGFIEGRIMHSGDYQVLRKRSWLQLNSLVVDSSFRGNGVAQTLFDNLVEWGKCKNAESVELNVYSFNKVAIEFYKKNGFSEIVKSMTKSI